VIGLAYDAPRIAAEVLSDEQWVAYDWINMRDHMERPIEAIPEHGRAGGVVSIQGMDISLRPVYTQGIVQQSFVIFTPFG
jgi:hypothetical protein